MRAVVTGATGLIGKELLRQLLSDDRFERIVVFARRSTGLISSKLEEHLLVSFDDVRPYYHYMRGDVMFCALGTTIKKAGSQENFRKADYGYVLNFALAAKAMEVKHFVLVSSIGANSNSKSFYLRVKAETENAVINTGIEKITILRPSMLLGKREEFRAGERAGILFARVFAFWFTKSLRRFRPVRDAAVAGKMIQECFTERTGVKIIESDEIQLYHLQ